MKQVLETIFKIDEALFLRMYSYPSPQLTQIQIKCLLFIRLIMKTFSISADGPWYFLLPVAIWFLEPKLVTPLLITGLLAFAVELPAYKLLKHFFKRQRPANYFNSNLRHISQLIHPPDEYSFPSGHTAGAWIIATLIAYFCFPQFPILISIMYGWAALVAYSRVFLGVHFPVDVFFGCILGIVCASGSIFIAQYLFWIN